MSAPFAHRALLSACVLAAAVGLACDDGTSPDAALLALTIDGLADSVVQGATAALSLRWSGAPPTSAVVAWTVAPEALGTVDANGVFRSASPGQGVVSATARVVGGTAVASATVAVLPRDCATSVSIVPIRATLAVGGRTTLRAWVPARVGTTCDGRDSVRVGFASLDPSVVTVDALGTIQGRTPGVARVAAFPLSHPEVRATADVTVLGTSPGVLITASPSPIVMAPGDSQLLRVAVNLPPNATPGMSRGATFSSRDRAVASVDSTGLVRAGSLGATTVIVRALADTSVFTAVPVTVRTP